MYCYGHHVVVKRDHRPLLAIYKKALAVSPKRLQRMWLLYSDTTFNWCSDRSSGEMIMADTLSRAFPDASEGTATASQEEVATLSTVDEN